MYMAACVITDSWADTHSNNSPYSCMEFGNRATLGIAGQLGKPHAVLCHDH